MNSLFCVMRGKELGVAFTIMSLIAVALGMCDPLEPAQDPAEGNGWILSKIGGGGYILNILVDPTEPSRLYSHVDIGGIYRSDDGGDTWMSLNAALPSGKGAYEVRSMDVDPRDGNIILAAIGSQWEYPLGIFRSVSGGKDWQLVLNLRIWGNHATRAQGHLLARNPASSDVILAGSAGDGVWRSENAGSEWRETGLRDVFVTDVHFSECGGMAWVCGQELRDTPYVGGLFRSLNGGVSWDWVGEEAPSQLVSILNPEGDTLLYGVFGNSRVKRSTDLGATWNEWGAGLPSGPRIGEANDASTFYAVTVHGNRVFVGNGRGEIFYIDEGGFRWSQVRTYAVRSDGWWGNTELPSSTRQEFQHFGAAMSSLTIQPERWFLTDWFGIYRSFDDGSSWDLRIDGIESSYVHGMYVSQNQPYVVHVGLADNGYFRSDDGGSVFLRRHWDGGANIKSITGWGTQGGLLALGGSGHRSEKVFQSPDSGDSWTALPSQGLPKAETIGFNSLAADYGQGVVFITASGENGKGKGGIYRWHATSDRWEWFGQGLPKGTSLFSDEIFESPGKELAVDLAGNLLALSRATNQIFGRQNDATGWLAMDRIGLGELSTIIADSEMPHVFYLGSSAGLWKTKNSGESWQSIFSGDVRFVVQDVRASQRIALVRADGNVFISNNRGQGWDSLPPLPLKTRKSCLVFSSHGILAGTPGGGIFRFLKSEP